jgi:hypothetical protein
VRLAAADLVDLQGKVAVERAGAPGEVQVGVEDGAGDKRGHEGSGFRFQGSERAVAGGL